MATGFIKIMFSLALTNTILLAANPLSEWAEFGLNGLIIGAVFIFIIRPFISILREDKKSDSELMKQLVENITALTNEVKETKFRNDERFSKLDGDICEVKSCQEELTKAVTEIASKMNVTK